MPIRRREQTLADHQALDIIDQTEPEVGRVIVNSTTPEAADPAPSAAGLPPDLLDAPAGLDDDLAHALAVRPSRRQLPGVTAVLGAAVLVSGGFLVGVLVQKHEAGSSSGTGNAAALAAAFGRARTGGATAAAGTGTGIGGGATIGTVKLVDGSTVYVTTTDGSIVKVITSKATTIKVTKDGTAGDLAPGTTVLVQGTAGTDGVVKATSVTQVGGGLAGGFGARNRAGTGTATGPTGTSGGLVAPPQAPGN